LHTDTTGAITVSPGSISTLELLLPQTTTTNVSFTLTIIARDKDQNTITTTIIATITDTTGTIMPQTVTLVSGTWTGQATITISPNGGIDTITASYGAIKRYATITVYINPGATQVIGSPYGTINLIETGSITEGFYVTIKDAKNYSTFTTRSGNIGLCIDVKLIKTSGAEFHGSFTILVSVPYNNTGNINEETLRLYTFNEQTRIWEEVPNSWANPANKIIYGTLTHLTLIAPFGTTTFAQTNNNAYCYPNLCKKGSTIYFTNVSNTAIIKIYTIAGELVKDIEVDESIEKWDIENIASGVYIYTITGGGGGKKIGKIGIVK
jgi:hypothetical protein